MKPQSGKAKGRRLQQWLRQELLKLLNVAPEDIESRSMGAAGEDLMLSQEARRQWPYSVECKNQEALNLWSSWDQTCANAGDYEPVLFIKKNYRPVLAVISAEHFLQLSTTQKGDKNESD